MYAKDEAGLFVINFICYLISRIKYSVLATTYFRQLRLSSA